MIHFYNDTKTYIYSPAGVVTGGSELLHQLADLLNRNGKQAYLIYYGNSKQGQPDAYKNYMIYEAQEIEDNEHNVVVLYEGALDKTKNIKNCQIILWWLSVDLMYHSSMKYLALTDILRYSPKLAIYTFTYRMGKLLLHHENYFMGNISLKELSKKNYTNAYQSVYAQNFLYKKGFSELFPLTDYINVDFIKSCQHCEKKDVVLYNPKKGYKFTKKIIEANKDLTFLPIQNLTREGVVELMHSSKVYIDFGFHPGKDRIPREAALSGCIVITGKGGSAYYYEDVSLPSNLKFDTTVSNINVISKSIRNSLLNYSKLVSEMDYYVKRILDEKKIFEEQVKKLISL